MGNERKRRRPDGVDLLFFEIELRQTGLAADYEKAEILPAEELPANPFDIEEQHEQWEQWAEEHSDEYKKFNENLEQRERVLRKLFQQRRRG